MHLRSFNEKHLPEGMYLSGICH